jgi:hypothetical protein
MFAEFTELFSAHCCTGRQHFTSSVVPSLCGSLIVVAAWLSVKFAINNPHTITKLIIVRVRIAVSKIFVMRLWERRSVFRFLSHLATLPSRASVILFSKIPPNYFAAAYIDRGRIVLIMLVQDCYTAKAEATSFLRSSYGHPQVHTVPSSARDAPCPVVTPSQKGLARHFLFILFSSFRNAFQFLGFDY